MSTDKNIQEDVVIALLSHRIPVVQICRYLKMHFETFMQEYGHLNNVEPCIDQNQAVETSIFELSVKGNHQCAMFWMKNKALWDDGKTEREQADREALKGITIDRIEIHTIKNKPTDDEEDT